SGPDGNADDRSNPVDPTGRSSARPFDFGIESRTPSGAPAAPQHALFDATPASSERNAPIPYVQLAQYAPARPPMPWSLPWPGRAIIPGTPENKAYTDDFIHSNIRAGRAVGDWLWGILHNESGDPADKPAST